MVAVEKMLPQICKVCHHPDRREVGPIFQYLCRSIEGFQTDVEITTANIYYCVVLMQIKGDQMLKRGKR